MKAFYKVISALITFILSFFILGLGLVAYNKTKYALAMVCTAYSALALICWTNLIETPAALFCFLLFIALIQVASALFSAFITFSEKSREYSKIKAWIKATVFGGVTIPLLVVVFLNKSDLFGYDIYFIPSPSMAPELLPGDYILINSKKYINSPPKKGDIALFKHPKDNSKVFIKRVVGISGEKLGVTKNIIRPLDKDTETSKYRVFNIEPDYYFVAGDNRQFSRDSRHWGPVHKDKFIGSAIYIWLSTDINRDFRSNRVGKIIK